MQTKNAAQTANPAVCRTEQEAFVEGDLEMIIFIESLSELFQNESSTEKYPAQHKNEERQTVSFVKELKTALNMQKNTKHQNCEDIRQIAVGCLHGKIFSKENEERLIHLADAVIRFQMKENGGKLERLLFICKYKGADASGNILKYTIENGKIQIENKKRIY
ncbi:hypothetical protein [Methanimicrococcus hongohii]|nr:hypothetical protein [Methanimicrococcus sp. Hf6]